MRQFEKIVCKAVERLQLFQEGTRSRVFPSFFRRMKDSPIQNKNWWWVLGWKTFRRERRIFFHKLRRTGKQINSGDSWGEFKSENMSNYGYTISFRSFFVKMFVLESPRVGIFRSSKKTVWSWKTGFKSWWKTCSCFVGNERFPERRILGNSGVVVGKTYLHKHFLLPEV